MAIPNPTHDARFTRDTVRRFVRALSNFATSVVRWQAARYLATLLGLLLAISGLNVLNSYVGRDFMTAIEHRDRGAFLREAFLYLAVFGASTTAAVFLRYNEERFGLLWREWLTGWSIRLYLVDQNYLRLAGDHGLANPDQRIAEDVRTFVTTTLSLFLMFLNATLTIVAFSGVLWSISRTLFVVGVVYAAAGSLLTMWLGRRLVDLNYRQSDREADFRAALIHVRENAESLALQQRERALESRLFARLDALVGNTRRIISINRDLGFFTTGYNYLIQIIPALIVAPLFMRGDVEFGVITQSAMAFSLLLNASSLIITQFQAISSYAAVLARLHPLAEGVQPDEVPMRPIRISDDPTRLAYDRLTLRAPTDGRVLVRELTVDVARGTRLLIRSDDAVVRGALMRATAGLWENGEGHILRPAGMAVAFVPEEPYLPPGTLRDVVGAGDRTPAALDAEIHRALADVGVTDLVAELGLDQEHDWDKMLPLREQQLLVLARLLLTTPTFAFVDDLDRTLGAERAAEMFRLLAERDVSCVMLNGSDATPTAEDSLLELRDDGSWSFAAERSP